ncbi:MAG TPA: HAD family phosphatase [Stenomitos sp.]
MTFPFEAVLFDMDGVVVDNMPLHRHVWAKFARMHGLDPTEAEIRTADGRRAVDVVRMLFGSDLTASRVADLAAQREDIYHQELKTGPLEPVAGVRAFLTALGKAGIPRVLATSATPENIQLALGRLDLLPMFEAMVSAVDVRQGKPHPEVYLTAAARAKAAPDRCLVVEDALPGVQAAKAAGASCLGLMTSQSEEALREVGADWVAPNFLALPAPLSVLVR